MNKLTTKELINILQKCDPAAYVLLEDGYNLRYISSRVEQDEAVALSADEVDVLSNYIDLAHMESEYQTDVYESLDFFSIVSLHS